METTKNVYADILTGRTLETVTKDGMTIQRPRALRKSDVDAQQWAGYKSRIEAVADTVHAYIRTADEGKDVTTSRKKAVEAVQAFADHIILMSGMKGQEITIQKRDIDFLVRVAVSRRHDKDSNIKIKYSVKSDTSFASIVLDVLYLKYNGFALTVNGSKQIERRAEARKREAESSKFSQMKQEPKPAKKSAKAAPKTKEAPKPTEETVAAVA